MSSLRRPAETTAKEARRARRAEEIVVAATRLFRERGFHGTSLDDVGAEIGITGSAIYRHFANKEDLLVALFRKAWVARQAGVAEASSLPPFEALRELVHSYVEVAIEYDDVIAIYRQEQRYLSMERQKTLVADTNRFIDAWATTLKAVRPELTDDEAQGAAFAATNLVSSVGHYQTDLPRDRLAHLLETMAWEVLMADSPAPSGPLAGSVSAP